MYLQSPVTRWTLGASDIMFTNPAFSTFFRKGETFRGTSIYQPAIDTAVKKLRAGARVHKIHLFAEGKVCQPHTYATDPQSGLALLWRFKWGIDRIVMETPRSHNHPHEDNRLRQAYARRPPRAMEELPSTGAGLSVTFGAQVSLAAVHGA
ncbi:hypothetical protein EDB84DRAFT_1557723 [Lactarius hengduanensis]|nr:hypothetical protein EDB84DRAFT_1557723 [Lactarius hengduanensis]